MRNLRIKKFIKQEVSRFKNRVIDTKVDATKVFSDLLTLLGYFAISSYLGGLSYINSYFKAFGILSNLSLEISATSIIFVNKVLIIDWLNIILTLMFLMFFSFTYFCTKYVLKAWFGYLILCVLFGTSIMLAIGLGSSMGLKQAKKDWTDISELPIITVKENSKNCSSESSTKELANPRFLHEDKNYIYFFEPKSSPESDNHVNVVPKKCIQMIKVNPVEKKSKKEKEKTNHR